MFGYIRPFKPEMKIKDFDTYKSFYCGLCKEMGSEFTAISRFTLSYDFSFLAMLAVAVKGNLPTICIEGCAFNPLKKKSCCKSCDELTFSANIAMIMLYYKIYDNINDEKFLKSLAWKTTLPFANYVHKKSALYNPTIENTIKINILEQSKLENEKCEIIDKACEPTAKSLAMVFSCLTQDVMQKRVLDRIGYFLGKYVYLCDAFDDLQDDLKSNSYNPYILSYNLVNLDNKEKLTDIINEAKATLYLVIGEAIKSYELLNVKCYKDILDNIFYLGLRATVNQIENKNIKLIQL